MNSTRRNYIRKTLCGRIILATIGALMLSATFSVSVLGQGSNTYVFTTNTSGTFTDMSSGTIQLVAPTSDDASSPVTNIGFDFYLLGVRYTQFSASSNGFIRLGSTAVGATQFTLGSAARTLITAYGSDLYTSGQVHFKVTGSAPNRVMTIEFLNEMIIIGGSGAGNDGTYQVRLYETTGVVEFVYGQMNRNDAAIAAPQYVGFSTSAVDNTYVTVTTATNTANTTGAPASNQPPISTPIANLNSPLVGSRRTYLFTPPTPAPPTALNFTGVTQAAMTLNWTDSPNESLYAVYRSTNGVNYNFETTLAQNTTSFPVSGLNPGVTYFWRVFAVSDGAFSTALSGSQATLPPGNITSAVSGNWNNTATWTGGVIPTSTDNVTISDGHTVTIDTNAVAANLVVGATPGGGAILQYDGVARTVTVFGDVSITAGSSFTGGASAVNTHILNIGGNSAASSANGNLVINGNFDMNGPAGVSTNFFGSSDGAISGTGATADFFDIDVNKGSGITAILDVTRLITIGVPAAAANRFGATNGTLRLSSASLLTPWFGNQIITAATGRLWLNNAGASTTVVGVVAGNPTFTGGLRIDAGTFGYGRGDSTLTFTAGTGNLVMNGGTLNMFGAVLFSANSSMTMTAGNFNVDPQATASLLATTNIFRFTGPNPVAFTGGTVTIIDPHAATGTGRALSISTSASTVSSYNFAGSTFRFGDGLSSTAGSVDGFDIDTFVNTGLVPIGNVIVDNPAANAGTRFLRANKNAVPFQMSILGDLTITNAGGSRFNLNGHLVDFGRNIINNGTLDGSAVGSQLYWLGNGVASTYSGSGTSTAPLASWEVDNALGVTLAPGVSNVVTNRIILFTGSVTNANKLTLGNGGVTTGVVQIGNATTPTAAGSFDVPFTFNLGTGGQTLAYLRTTASRSIGPEINPARTVTTFTYDDNDIAHSLTLGGNLTVTGNTALTNGHVITGPNTLIVASGGTVTRTSGLVDGNLRKTFTAVAIVDFEVGTANGYSPASLNATSGTFPAVFTVKATQAPQPSVNPATSLQRYWTLSGSGITANLTFQYLPGDVMGNENIYKIIRVIGVTPVAFPTSVVTPATDIATLAGVSNFSDWTVGEITTPTAAPATISGQVTTTSGAPLAGVTMYLSGGKSARTITDSNGNYRFINVDTENFYTVTPSILNHTFSPANLSFSLVANVTDAVFSGTRNVVSSGNVIDTPEYFVRQHYLDFLGREPDDAGLNFWSDQILGCGNDFNCVERRTINVSAAYFLSIEFQETGGLVDGLYRASYGRAPLYDEFMPDAGTISKDLIVGQSGWEQVLATNKQEFLDAWVQRAAFRAAYDNLSNDGYVDALIGNTGVNFTTEEREALLDGLNHSTLTRAALLQLVAQDERFVKAKFNEAFVRMQYFGYLRRDPDDSGFNFWLNKLNEFDGNFEQAEMVKAFITSGEYRARFAH